MEITRQQNGSALTLILAGRLDTLSAPQFETELKQNLNGVETLTLDLAGIDYVSSAGLRVLLTARKLMDKQGRLSVVNVSPGVMEVFEMTGFVDVLSLKK